MFIFKENEFLTPEEQDELIILQAELSKRITTAKGEYSVDSTTLTEEEFREKLSRRADIIGAAEGRYIAAIVDDKDKILANVSEIINAISQRDYRKETTPTHKQLLASIAKQEAALKETTDEKRRKILQNLIHDETELLDNYYSYNFHSVRNFLTVYTSTEREALKRGGHGEAEYDSLINERAAQFYPSKAHIRPLTAEEMAAYNETTWEQLSLFGNKFMPMLQGTLTSGLMPLSTKGLTADRIRGGDAVARPKEDYTIVIKGYDKLQGDLGVSAKKILDAATVVLTQINSYVDENPLLTNPTVEIDLMEYARANGYKVDRQPVGTPEDAAKQEARIEETLRDLKTKINRDLDYISNVSQTFTEEKGKNKGDYTMLRIISSHSIKRGKIRINFDPDAARYLSRSYIMQYPTALLKHDNRNPNSYAIGRKIAYHNSLDNNMIVGTANTLSVMALLDSAPEIQTLDELKAKGRRDWKVQIKDKLEKALDDNISIGYLSRWEYSTKDHSPLTREQAAGLTAEEYMHLYVDFAVIDAPDQTERLAAKTERKKIAASGTQKRKRGRPPKKKE